MLGGDELCDYGSEVHEWIAYPIGQDDDDDDEESFDDGIESDLVNPVYFDSLLQPTGVRLWTSRER